MCEHFIARAAEPFRLDELWPFTERLERFGLAGFGWGAAWLGGDGRSARTATSGRSATIRDARPSGHRDDLGPHPPPASVAPLDADAARHTAVRRPGRPLRVQPQRRPADYKDLRATYRAQGRIHGRADTEVGARWLEDAWRPEEPAATCSPRSTTGSAARPTSPSWPPTGRRTTTRATARTPSSRSGSAGSASRRPGSTRSIVALPVRGAGRHRPPAGPLRTTCHARP